MTRENLLMLCASFLIAVSIRVILAPDFAPGQERELDARLELQGLPQWLTVIGEPKTVRVVASGSHDSLDKLNSNTLVATVDLSGAKQGENHFTVKIPASSTRVPIVPRSPTVRLRIEKVSSKEQSIDIEASGKTPADLVYDGASIVPQYVTIVGGESFLNLVKRVRILIDLSQVRPGVSLMIPVEVLDEANRPVPYVRAEPSEVSVSPAVAAAPAVKRVLISPSWVGQPAFGFKVDSFEVKPAQLGVKGDSAKLSRLVTIETEPLNISGLRSDVTLLTRAKLPEGIETTDSLNVRVFIKIVSTNGAESTKH